MFLSSTGSYVLSTRGSSFVSSVIEMLRVLRAKTAMILVYLNDRQFILIKYQNI